MNFNAFRYLPNYLGTYLILLIYFFDIGRYLGSKCKIDNALIYLYTYNYCIRSNNIVYIVG